MSATTSALLYTATVTPAAVTKAVPEEAAEKRHHVKGGRGFTNPWESYSNASLSQVLGALVGRRITGHQHVPDTTPPTVPVVTPSFLSDRTAVKDEVGAELRATWLGHACYYIEFPSGLRVLFDPVFSDCCGPCGRLGPKRYNPPPCAISDLPHIDAVVISHSHYDHLDYNSVLEAHKNNPNVHFFVPLGNAAWFSGAKIPASQVTELDWWESRDVLLSNSNASNGSEVKSAIASTIGATITALPCQHTSGRTPFDRDRTLWASWAVKSGSSSVYFAGDTGYRSVPRELDPAKDHTPETQPLYPHCPAFADIGKFAGPFDLGLIPIGAYDPRYIMSPMHSDPFDAVEILRDTRCRRALGMHWGTWVLTEEDVMEPPVKLKEALTRRGMPTKGIFDICDIGESRLFKSHGSGDTTVDWEINEKS